jgi:hypothetical protein
MAAYCSRLGGRSFLPLQNYLFSPKSVSATYQFSHDLQLMFATCFICREAIGWLGTIAITGFHAPGRAGMVALALS